MIDVDPGLAVYGYLSRYTTPLSFRERSKVAGTCFPGLGMFNCVPGSTYDPFYYNLPYYNNLPNLRGEVYCTECCGANPTEIDTWDLYCPVDSTWQTKLQSTTYIGAVFRFATMKNQLDLDVVECALPHPACTYSDSGETLSCDLLNPGNWHIIGYELKLRVQQYSEFDKYWKGVSSCTATTTTRNYPLAQGELFNEVIIMDRHPIMHEINTFQIGILLWGLSFFVFVACYFCRRDICVVCQSKLILFFDRCFLCRLFGAYIPDPLLLQALKEKGEIIRNQNQEPPRFPGARFCTGTIRFLWKCVRGKCCQSNAIVPMDLKARELADAEKEMEKSICEKYFCCCYCCYCSAICGSCYCCKKTKKKKVKDPKKIKVVELKVEPYVLYEAIGHPRIPADVQANKLKIDMEYQYKEDMELYGDLTTSPVKKGTAQYDAKMRQREYIKSKKEKRTGLMALLKGQEETEWEKADRAARIVKEKKAKAKAAKLAAEKEAAEKNKNSWLSRTTSGAAKWVSMGWISKRALSTDNLALEIGNGNGAEEGDVEQQLPLGSSKSEPDGEFNSLNSPQYSGKLNFSDDAGPRSMSMEERPEFSPEVAGGRKRTQSDGLGDIEEVSFSSKLMNFSSRLSGKIDGNTFRYFGHAQRPKTALEQELEDARGLSVVTEADVPVTAWGAGGGHETGPETASRRPPSTSRAKTPKSGQGTRKHSVLDRNEGSRTKRIAADTQFV